MRAQLLHLSGPRKGRTVTYDGAKLEVGSRASCDVRLHGRNVEPDHAVLTFVESECAFHLKRREGRVFVNQQEIEEVILADGDLIEWGIDGPKTRFRIWVEPGRTCKPVRRMIRDARDVAQHSGSLAATGTLARDLVTQSSRRLRIGIPVAIALASLPLSFLAGWLGSRPMASRLLRASDVTAQELESLREAQQEQAGALSRVRERSLLVKRVQDHWSRSVCLIYGSFGFAHPRQGPLRDSAGDRLRIEYTGSGFLVDERGHIVTNRHIVKPWEEMEVGKTLAKGGYLPEFLAFTATFPGRDPAPIDPASIRTRGDRIDVSVLAVDPKAVEGLPPLPLHQDSLDDLEDLRALVVGYPTGLAALLARADQDLVDRLRRENAAMPRVIAELAKAKSILPTVTEGIFSQSRANPAMLSYDAMTTHGGSGGPVFGSDGSVIAVNFAIMEGFGGANFGVPIRYAKPLLR
ncbi:MAG: hypothetical protein Fur0037_08140 [Planctomycetota bacterium]